MRAGGGPYRQFSYRQQIPNASMLPAREALILGSWLAERLCFWQLTRIETGVIQREGRKTKGISYAPVRMCYRSRKVLALRNKHKKVPGLASPQTATAEALSPDGAEF